jgi:hypothetical protein
MLTQKVTVLYESNEVIHYYIRADDNEGIE